MGKQADSQNPPHPCPSPYHPYPTRPTPAFPHTISPLQPISHCTHQISDHNPPTPFLCHLTLARSPPLIIPVLPTQPSRKISPPATLSPCHFTRASVCAAEKILCVQARPLPYLATKDSMLSLFTRVGFHAILPYDS